MFKNKDIFQFEQRIEWLEKKTKYKKLEKVDIHEGQPEILAYIYMHKDCNQYEIARYLGLSRASIGVSIKRLEKRGYVLVQNSEKDLRSKSLAITKIGTKALVDSDRILDDFISSKYQGFSSEDLETYQSLLRKIERNLRKMYQEDKK